RPKGVVVLVAIFLVRLRNDPPRPELNLPLLEHDLMLLAGPVLDGREAEPRRRAVLMFRFYRVAGGQVSVGVVFVDEGARLMRPLFVPVAVEVVAQVPGNVGEGAQPRQRVADVPPFVLAAGGRLRLVSRNVQDRRNDDVAVAGVAQHALPLPPVGDVEPREADARAVEAFGPRRDPGPQEQG